MDGNTKDLINMLTTQMKDQQAYIEAIQESALKFGAVLQISTESKRAVLAVGGDILDVALPDWDIAPGDWVAITPMSGQILRHAPYLHGFGPVATVERIVSETTCEVKFQHTNFIVFCGAFGNNKRYVGRQVLLDPGMRIIMRILPPTDFEDFRADTVKVAWDAIGGLSAAKEAIEEAVVLPLAHPDLYAHYGKGASKGALLYGPPGNGKTMLAKAVATRLGDGAGMFLAIKGPEVLDKFIGETERAIRERFAAGRRYFEETGKPAVLFVDEADALLSKRGNGHHSMVQQTVVPTFLAEMDGMATSPVFVILATNRADALDEAVVRDDRIDRKIEITRPGPEDAREVLAIHIGNTPLATGDTKGDLIAHTVYEVYHADRKVGTNGASKPLSHIVSSAMLAGIVNHAKSSAIRRDLASQSKRPSGLLTGDFTHGVAMVQEENCHIQHAA